ncbi:MAG: MOSC domain-containing protein, partial [Paracoccaceae bacterium]
IDGLAPWQEFEWIGKRLRIGSVVLMVRERIVRCLATAANPDTGYRDADTLGALKHGWGHTDFGVYAEVLSSGEVAIGDSIEVIM